MVKSGNSDINDATNVPYLRTPIPGEKSKELLKKQKNLETNSVIYPKSFPIGIKRANGSVIEDVDGNRFIDWITGISVMNLGYSGSLREAISNQLGEIWHSLEIPTETRIEFLKKFSESFPSTMRDYKTVFGISGSDACETAVNIAHSISHRNASTFAFEGAYHGISGGIISATSGKAYRDPVYSAGFDVIRVPYPYKMWYKEEVSDIISRMERVMKDPDAGFKKPDSLLVEPVQGEGGYIVPPDGFLKAIREFCDEYDLTMIVDEVQSGMGRTGKMWAFEWENVEPDIVCVSKSVGGGIPISLVYYREDMDKELPTPFHLGTYRANPLAMAAGKVLMEETPKYLDRVISDGAKLKEKFSSIESDLIGEVRGKGFMVGIELVEDSKPLSKERVLSIKHDLLNNGLIMHTCGHFGNVFRFMGALNIPNELLDKGFEIFEKVIKEHGSK